MNSSRVILPRSYLSRPRLSPSAFILRGALPYGQTASAILLILAGAYVIIYWWTAQSVG